jgi:asparagine synthase (glutamine-hydrolysing)
MTHTRLAIIDLKTGDQPLFASNGNGTGTRGGRHIALIANGEIYNDLELRAELGEDGFATGSDCESPLRLYLQIGRDFAERLRGMYAIAIHDPGDRRERHERLLLARDPFGIKPLYVAELENGLAFASEAQALIAAGLVAPVLHRRIRDELLQLQFTTGRATPFVGIERLLPGETLVVEDGRIVDRRQLAALPMAAPKAWSEADALSVLDEVLLESVHLHQRSDVPYGMFLSGGVDSSAILAAMSRLNQRPVVAFTAGFAGERSRDEREHARKVAKAAGADHVEVTVDEQDCWRLLPQVAACMDDPAADFAILPSFRLAARVREAGIKVVLTGEGGDEIFAGYGRYRRTLRPWFLGGRQMRARGIFDGLEVLRDESGWREGYSRVEALARQAEITGLQAAQAVDCAAWLPNDLLIKLDRCLMAHGVEGRVPFLDPVLARFAFRLPDPLKLGHGLGKRLLRRWLDRALPEADAFSAKRGFTVPVAEWIAAQAGRLAPLVARQPGVVEACDPAKIDGLFRSAAAGRKRAGKAAWTLLFFALWHHRHILGQQPGEDVFETLSPA